MASYLSIAAYILFAWTYAVAARASGIGWVNTVLIGILVFVVPFALTVWSATNSAGASLTEVFMGLVMLAPAILVFGLVKSMAVRQKGKTEDAH